MIFNSFIFALFFFIIYFLYWFINPYKLKIQNILLLVSSYFFYACWDWRFLFLLIFSTLLDYFTGLQMENSKTENHRKFWFWLSVLINLGFLGFFKYFNFFSESFAAFVSEFGIQVNPFTLQVILPIGISFYTFHGLSYVIDIYKKRISAERNFIDYSVFVCFFPLLVAGPIERATHLLPQIKKKRVFDYSKSVDGLRQILWGLFKKIVIADQCAEFANQIFNNSADYSGISLVLGALFFSIQIYGDFSGYSDIALGVARLMGIELLKNFSYPYFSRDIAEFWRRWHISLSSWFKDYLYIPLGGNTGGMFKKIRNTFIIFIVSGFWHGANWTFIVWGFLNALFIIPSIIFKTNRNNLEIVAKGSLFPTFKELRSIILTFILTSLTWIFFRAESMKHALSFIKGIFVGLVNKSSYIDCYNLLYWEVGLLLPFAILFFFYIEWIGREQPFALAKIGYNWKSAYRLAFYYALTISLFLVKANVQEFIYFQF